MPTKHVTKQIEAYLDRRLSIEEKGRVEEHISTCPICAHRLFEAKQLANELGPLMQKALGQPTPSVALRYKIRQQIEQVRQPGRFHFPWAASGRLLNAVGTLAVVTVLILGAFMVIRGQLPSTTNQPQLSLGQDGGGEEVVVVSNTPALVLPAELTSAPPPVTSLGDRLPADLDGAVDEETTPSQSRVSPPENGAAASKSLQEEHAPYSKPEKETGAQSPAPPIPDGTIAFSFFNAGAAFYEIHLVDPKGTNRRRFPVDGVSEPALRKSERGEYQIAYRTWGEPTTPRALISNDLSDTQPDALTHFWEDSHPDWSPTEFRIIFASQRESDRRWRLYTVWGDGSEEVDLRREGKSPTFAPDGHRFAFVGCEEPLNKLRCGLLVGDLDNSEYGAKLILEAPQAAAPDWSPVGEQIAYMANSNGNWDLYLVNGDGGHSRRLTNDSAIDGLPTWSPDGQWLAFLSNRNGKWGVWALHIDSGQTQAVVDLKEGDLMVPARPPYEKRNWQDEQLSWVE